MVDAAQNLDSHALAWRARLVEFLIPRLVGANADKAQSLDMVLAGLDQAMTEGIRDSASVIAELIKNTEGDKRRALEIAHKALIELARRNEMDTGTAQEPGCHTLTTGGVPSCHTLLNTQRNQ